MTRERSLSHDENEVCGMLLKLPLYITEKQARDLAMRFATLDEAVTFYYEKVDDYMMVLAESYSCTKCTDVPSHSDCNSSSSRKSAPIGIPVSQTSNQDMDYCCGNDDAKSIPELSWYEQFKLMLHEGNSGAVRGVAVKTSFVMFGEKDGISKEQPKPIPLFLSVKPIKSKKRYGVKKDSNDRVPPFGYW